MPQADIAFMRQLRLSRYIVQEHILTCSRNNTGWCVTDYTGRKITAKSKK